MNIISPIQSLLIAAGVVLATAASAQVISPVSITAVGSFNNSLSLLADGFVPPETTNWTAAENVFWTGFDTAITLDYGSSHKITDVLLSVDNNDAYLLEYSLDGITFNSLFTVMVSDGNIPENPGGMDTMSTDASSADYVMGIDFAPVMARFLRFQAVSGGDAFNSVGEIAVTAELGGAVPEPSTYGLIGAAALLGLAAIRRRRQRRV